jgi:hypothetical protein
MSAKVALNRLSVNGNTPVCHQAGSFSWTATLVGGKWDILDTWARIPPTSG